MSGERWRAQRVICLSVNQSVSGWLTVCSVHHGAAGTVARDLNVAWSGLKGGVVGYDDFEDFDEAYEQASSLLDTIIKSLPKAVLCEIIGSLEYASSYSWEKVNADDYRLDDPDVWYRNIVI